MADHLSAVVTEGAGNLRRAAIVAGHGAQLTDLCVDHGEQILDAAATIFAEKGYDATSIQDIAESVDILKGSLYYYVNSKEDLLYEVIEEVHEAGLANMQVQQAADETTAPLDRLRRLVVEHVTYNAENVEKIAVFFHDFRSLTDERRERLLHAAFESRLIPVVLHLLGPLDVAEWRPHQVVMGAYGHSRLREYALGGATRDILRHMTVPVLFAH